MPEDGTARVAINAFGRRRVQVALLTYLQTGTDRERAGFGPGSEADEAPDVVTAWREASLREFVADEDLDVRCCILPGLLLKAESSTNTSATASRLMRSQRLKYRCQ